MADDPVRLAAELLDDLHRLVEAIDVRVPRPERVAETQIALDAAELREKAMKVIRRIESAKAAGG